MLTFAFLALLFAPSCELAITHAAVLDVRTGAVLEDRTVLMCNGTIAAVSPTTRHKPEASRVIDAHGRGGVTGDGGIRQTGLGVWDRHGMARVRVRSTVRLRIFYGSHPV